MRMTIERQPAPRYRAAAERPASQRAVHQARLPWPDRRPSAVAQRVLLQLVHNSDRVARTARLQAVAGSPPIQRMPHERAQRVHVTFNTWYHVGAAPVTSGPAAVALTQQRRLTGWAAARNHVVYDFNQRNLAETLYHRLRNDEYHVTATGHLLVQLPDVNYYIVNYDDTWQLSGGQCGILVDPHTMNAYHMVFP